MFFLGGIDPAPAPAASGGRRQIGAFDQTVVMTGNSPPLPRGAASRLAPRLAQKAWEARFTNSSQYISIASVEATPGKVKPCFDA